jgi:hypothetical protein
VSRSRSLPFSAIAGETRTRAVKAMQTLHTHPASLGKCIDTVPKQSDPTFEC